MSFRMVKNNPAIANWNYQAMMETLTISVFCHPVVWNMHMEHNRDKNRANMVWQEVSKKKVGLQCRMHVLWCKEWKKKKERDSFTRLSPLCPVTDMTQRRNRRTCGEEKRKRESHRALTKDCDVWLFNNDNIIDLATFLMSNWFWLIFKT